MRGDSSSSFAAKREVSLFSGFYEANCYEMQLEVSKSGISNPKKPSVETVNSCKWSQLEDNSNDQRQYVQLWLT